MSLLILSFKSLWILGGWILSGIFLAILVTVLILKFKGISEKGYREGYYSGYIADKAIDAKNGWDVNKTIAVEGQINNNTKKICKPRKKPLDI